MVLHHLGDSTARDIAQVQEECEQAGAKTVVVPGDIAEAKTASDVSWDHHLSSRPKVIRTTADNPWLFPQIVAAAVSSFSRIDVLVSNAGICPFHSFLDLPHPLWKRVQDVNLNGSFYIVQAVANQMAKQEPKGGSIVAVSSISALMGGGEQCHYTPTKAGIKSLMESCAIALGPMGIRCNSVLPGTFYFLILAPHPLSISSCTYAHGSLGMKILTNSHRIWNRNHRNEHQQRRPFQPQKTNRPNSTSPPWQTG